MKLNARNLLAILCTIPVCSPIALAVDATALKDAKQTGLPATQDVANKNSAQSSPQSAGIPPIPAAETASTGALFESTNLAAQTAANAQKTTPVLTTAQTGKDSTVQIKADEVKPALAPAAALATQATQTATQLQTAAQATTANTPVNTTKDSNGATTPATAATLETQQAVVPNGAALQTQLMPLGQSSSSPWSTLMAGGFLILGIAAAGVMIVRLKQGRGLALGKTEKQLQLITSMHLAPKRQIILVRIRDKEVALASTEHGITLLTELQAQSKNNLSLIDDGGNEEPRRRKVQQRQFKDEPGQLVASSAQSDESVGQETAAARSEMLLGALKNLREKNLKNKFSKSEETEQNITSRNQESNVQERKTDALALEKSKPESTMKQTRAAFPKYLANAFEQESRRALPTQQSQQSQQNQQSQDDAGSVTNMIRERLKELRPLS